jgi:hypothetical protein
MLISRLFETIRVLAILDVCQYPKKIQKKFKKTIQKKKKLNKKN